MSTPAPRGFVLVLASWRPDAPAGIERATAALAAGLAEAGHRAVIATAAPQPAAPALAGVAVEDLDLGVVFPCDDDTLRAAVTARQDKTIGRLCEIAERHKADTIVFTDALWGLGRIAPALPVRYRCVLAAHVLPHHIDMRPALQRADAVIVPSAYVRDEAAAAGWPSASWKVVPNALLQNPDPQPAAVRRERAGNPVRVLARLGPEKGVLPLLEAAADHAPVQGLEVVLAAAGFEETPGAQRSLLERCRRAADAAPRVNLRTTGLPWQEVPGWLAGASVVIVPSLKETFGLVALEAMSVGTPVVAHQVGNLPALLDHGPDPTLPPLLADPRHGPEALLRLVQGVLADPVTYGRTSEAMYHLSQDYRPVRVAQLLVKAVS
ncbi:glycosyltransferase family 4 protein [Streptomyces sp. NPDC056400]|uniref:glycosyltransferase family 4 protein n=1 Tax=Streptomyces sp. NPDC056400 TaxID=3345808 RepID=UPI0035D6D5E7